MRKIFIGSLVGLLIIFQTGIGICKTQLGLFCEQSLDGATQLVPKSVEYTCYSGNYEPGISGHDFCRIVTQDNAKKFLWTYIDRSPGLLLLTKLKWDNDIKKFIADINIPLITYQSGEIELTVAPEQGYYAFHFGEMTEHGIQNLAKLWDFRVVSTEYIKKEKKAIQVATAFGNYLNMKNSNSLLLGLLTNRSRSRLVAIEEDASFKDALLGNILINIKNNSQEGDSFLKNFSFYYGNKENLSYKFIIKGPRPIDLIFPNVVIIPYDIQVEGKIAKFGLVVMDGQIDNPSCIVD